ELDNGDVLFGGSFSTIDGSPVRRLARLQGSTWSQLGGGVEGYVSELVPAPNGDVYAVGSISAAGGIAVNNVARWDGTGWSPVGGGTDRAVSAAAVLPNGDLVVVGYFTMAGGVPVSRVARWDGIAWHPLGTGIGSSAFASVQDAAVLPNGDLVVTGDFGLAGGVAAHNIARWDGASWWPFGAGLDRGGTGLGVRPNGDLLVGGYFATADTVAAQCVAVWNGTTFSPLGAGVGSGGGNHVRTFVTLPNGDLLVGGDFFAAGGVTANNIARWNGTGWTAFGTGADGDVQALALLRSGTLAVGGTFLSVDGDVSTFHGWLGTTCPPSTSVVPTGCVGPVGPVVLAAATAPFVGGRFDTTATGLANGALALAIVGLGQQSIPLAQLHPAGLPGCDLLSSTEAVRLLLPSAGTVTNSLAIPNDLGLVGVQLVHQFVQAELDPQGGVVSLSSSNALRFQVGAF
ncbi:MAG: hypothetical protein KDE27_28385, partial [Planctomycetes bacterium]|nr:hypothetical protein [Planctomycetota bacterium]